MDLPSHSLGVRGNFLIKPGVRYVERCNFKEIFHFWREDIVKRRAKPLLVI